MSEEIVSNTPSKKQLDDARERAMRKKADEIIAMELGETPSKVVKGPVPIVDEEMKHFTLNLADFADRIVIDNKTYMHGRTYNVTKRTYDTLAETQERGWEHQRQTEGKKENAYRNERNHRLGQVAA